MASGGREAELSSDDEFLQSFKKKMRKKTKKKSIALVDSSESDSDLDRIGKKKVKPLHDDSDENSDLDKHVQFYLDASNDSSGDNEEEKCAICLGKFTGQDIATPETCDHMFCFGCLREWCKNVNTCPIDRLKFHLMLIRHHRETKIYKRVSVDSSLDPGFMLDFDPDPFASSDVPIRCTFCGGQNDSEPLVPCPYCDKCFHPECLVQPLFSSTGFQRVCPGCYFSPRNVGSSHRYSSVSLNSLSSEFAALQRKNRKRLIRYSLDRDVTSSDSDSDMIGHHNLRRFEEPVPNSFPIARKRRRTYNLQSGQILIPAAGSETSHFGYLYGPSCPDVNSDDEIEDRYNSSESEQRVEPCPSNRNIQFSSFRNEIVSPNPVENFDVVGSILEGQNVLKRLDLLERHLDGSFTLGSSTRQSLNKNSTRTRESISSSCDDSELRCLTISRPVMPHTDSVTTKQSPLNPTQNSNSKYSETPQNNYTCTSSTSKEHFVDYDAVNFSSRNMFGNSGNEGYNNDNTNSTATNRSFCGSSSGDDIKKVSNCKESSKMHHSEDEVDIYSDIESVGDEDGTISTIEGVNDRLDNMEIPFKDGSPLSNPDQASDSSENELVIDEDMAGDDEENRKDNTQINKHKNRSDVESKLTNDSEESDSSDPPSVNEEQSTRKTPDVTDEGSYIDSRSAAGSQIEESSQASSIVGGGKTFPENDERTNGSEEAKHESESVEDQQFLRDEKGSSFADEKTPSENNVKSSSLDELKSEFITNDKIITDMDDQESCMDVADEDNSIDSSKPSPRAEVNTPCSTTSSKYCDEETKQEHVEDQFDNSMSSGVQEFDYAKNKDNSEPAYLTPVHTNENANASFPQVRENENSNCSFESSQHASGDQEAMDTNDMSQAFSEEDKKEDSDICQKSEDDQDECINDNTDYPENAGTPCLDENIDGQIENSPLRNDPCDSSDADSKMDVALSDIKSCQTPQSEGECENEKPSNSESEEQKPNEKNLENDVDLGIEDISEAGSGDLDDDFAEENLSFSDTKHDYGERENSNYEFNNNDTERYSKSVSKHLDDSKYQNSSHSNQSFEDREEGEIIDEKPPHRSSCKQDVKYGHYRDESEDFSEAAPRMNISDLPRIPKIKRDRVKDTAPVELPVENKRTSVLGRVDLGSADISWKRLSKHTRERSYRDGRPKEERVLYRERESRKKDKKIDIESEWRSESKSSSRRDNSKKQDSERTRNEKDSRSRKNEKKESKLSDWEYSDRDKHTKSHKDKHKEKHKDKKETKHDKSKYFKSDSKSSRDKIKDDDRFERELKFEKDQKFERVVYEKGKCKDKDHKNKHKEKKSESKSTKDHGREKHKHTHVSDHFSEKQREREVRKIDDKIKVVVEQKEGRKEKSKHKDKKESKSETKQIQVETRKKEIGRIPYTELTSIESKEIFAKGDSIIINVNFNRTNSPKDSNIDSADSNYRDRKSEECEVIDVISGSDKGKKLSEKIKSDAVNTKRPVTPPERTKQVLSVSECYWQGGEDSDANSDSDKSREEVTAEEENTMESVDLVEPDTFSNSFNSNDASEQEAANKETTVEKEKTPEKSEKPDNHFTKENETLSTPSKRKSPRSPSPPSPVDNDSYDPCEPTRSPSPPPVPPAPPLPVGNPKPPPSPELPPLPPEPEPVDTVHEENVTQQSTDFSVASSLVSSSQPVIVNNQTPGTNPISLPNVLLPPPSFLSHTAATTNSLTNLSSIVNQSNFNFQTNCHGNLLFQPNHVQQVIRGIVPNQIHANTAIPPPPNPPPLPNMGSVPPPPPPPSAMALLSQVRHPQINVRPTITPNTLLQNLTMGHSVTMPQMQMTHMHHIPPNFSTTLSNHQSPMMMPSQNQHMNIPVSISNQVSRVILNQNQMMNHSMTLQNQNLVGKPLGTVLTHQSLANSVPQKADKAPIEKNEVIDMEVDSPYSPGDFSIDDSVCDYSPTCSPLPSASPKTKDVFDSLLPTDHRTSDKRTYDAVGKAEKSKHGETKYDSKRAKHEHKKHSVRMQVDGKNKHRKEQKVEKKLDDSQLKILDDLPSSAVEMQVKEKFLKKLNRQERVVEEVKLALKPYYKSRDVTKEEYKDILRRSVPKICHNKSGEINPVKVKAFVENYIKKIKHARKKDKKKSLKLS